MAASSQRRAHLDAEQLREAIALANVPVLALVLVHLTGQRRWIEPPYQPSRNAGLTDNPTGGLSEEHQSEVREAALEAIERWRAGEPMALPTPALGTLVEMLGVSMGEPVPDEYGPMIAADLGIELPEQSPNGARASVPPGFQALIVGAGICGIAAGIALEQAGIPYAIVERNAGVGGTWLENRYPGCSVDTPSSIYSFSFAPNEWSRHFAGRDEVLAYLEQVAHASGVHAHIRFDTEVVGASYDEREQRWLVELRRRDGSSETQRASALITAVGAFTRPRMPDIPGLAKFAGPCVHTSRWPASGLDLREKRVGVIGNGASAMQVVPAIAEEVAELAVFQRSPQWIAPFPYLHAEVPPTLRRLGTEVPLYAAWHRVRWGWTFNDRLYSALQKDPQWPHPERAVNAENDAHRRFFTRYLEAETAGRPELRDAVMPHYPPFGKRILLDNGWYRALGSDHVQLVTDSIDHVERDRVVCGSGAEHPLDALICATGFDVVSFLAPIEIRGRSGRTLHETWDGDDARAYLGTVVPDFPNLFIMYGPNIQPGHGGSLFGLAEMQAHYIGDLLQQMLAHGIGALECKRAVWEAYNRRVDEAHEQMVWTHPGMETYYRNSRGRVVVPGPFRVVDLWHLTRSARLEEYECEHALRGGGQADRGLAAT